MTAPNCRILLVEDTMLLRTMIARQLTAGGFTQIVQAKNGQEAITMAQTHQPDIILLDIVMPVMLGTEALPELRKMLPNAMILMMSSLSEEAVVQECKEKGANGFVLKSGDGIAQAILERVRKSTGQQGSGISPPATAGGSTPGSNQVARPPASSSPPQPALPPRPPLPTVPPRPPASALPPAPGQNGSAAPGSGPVIRPFGS